MKLADALKMAVAHHNAGRLVEAGRLYDAILEAVPENIEALYLSGLARYQRGDPVAALSRLRAALTRRPDHPDTWCAVAAASIAVGDLPAGHEALAKIAELTTGPVPHLALVAAAFEKAGAIDDAIALYRRMANASQAPDNWAILGNACVRGRRFEAAIEAFENIGGSAVQKVDALNGMANAYIGLQDYPRARRKLEAALTLDPSSRLTRSNLAVVDESEGKCDAAIARYDTLLREDPDDIKVDWNRCLLQLKTGKYPEGFRAYQIHDKVAEFGGRRLDFAPEWRGEELAGKRIFVSMAQGLGDMVQFVRFVPWLARRGARVQLEAYAALARLFESVEGVERIVGFDQAPEPVDFQTSPMRLPGLFGVTTADLDADRPYLRPVGPVSPALDPAPELKVGLAWFSNPDGRYQHLKSIAAERLSPLFDLPGVRFYSLQVGVDEHDRRRLAATPVMIDVGPQLVDLSATAHAIAQLDLVVSIDTVVAHLAGAIGKPVWTLLPFSCDWRWLLDRDDSPWYSSMKLYRQPAPGDWDAVIDRVRVDLGLLAAYDSGRAARAPE